MKRFVEGEAAGPKARMGSNLGVREWQRCDTPSLATILQRRVSTRSIPSKKRQRRGRSNCWD